MISSSSKLSGGLVNEVVAAAGAVIPQGKDFGIKEKLIGNR